MLTITAMGIELGAVIREARKKKKLSMPAVAKQLGVSYPAVQQWEAGKTEPSTDNLLKLCRLLDLDPRSLVIDPTAGSGGFLVAAQDLAEIGLKPDVDLSKAEPVPANQRFGGPRNVPVLGTAVGGGDDDGDFRFNGDTIDYAPRPPGIANRKDVYALYVENDSMAPKYEPGERLYVDPHRAPRAMDYVVVELHGQEHGEPGKGFIKRLVKKTPGRIVLEQFNPPKQLEFDQARVKLLHRVIPYDELLGI